MNLLKGSFVIVLTLISFASFSQEGELLTTVPTKKKEFVKSEPLVINTINWFENTPLDQDIEKRKIVAANLIAWVTNSPTVTITFNSNVMPFTEKNNVLLVVFLGGWTKYALQNSYSKDEIKGSLAGLKSVIKFYQANKSLTKDEQMDKLIELDTNNKLEAWVAEQLAKK
ncbi:hypothetical protein A3860_09720 [Niastella vici]|uniref:Uncharacterized protein n=1 Tax=Niastella vici TaxID=1703345 RepID=A0A1V9FES3_9BACT|nr:hypothetical protein [Niastella vici]OQP56852.1 hypothetical protein A3860_09720 [Niastella vici]